MPPEPSGAPSRTSGRPARRAVNHAPQLAQSEHHNINARQVASPAAAPLEKTSVPKGALSRLKLDESTPGPPGAQSGLSPAQPSRDPVVSSVKLSSGPAAQAAGPRLTAARAKAESPANAAKRAPDRNTPEPQRARPEPFSIQEFLASHR